MSRLTLYQSIFERRLDRVAVKNGVIFWVFNVSWRYFEENNKLYESPLKGNILADMKKQSYHAQLVVVFPVPQVVKTSFYDQQVKPM